MSYNTFPTLPGLGWPVKETPKFATIQQQAVSGARYLTSLMSSPLRTIEVPINYLSQADRNTLRNFFLQQLGSGVPFYLTPSQYSYAINQVNFGTLDGTTTAFTLKDASGNAVQSATVSSIYRTDWQGRQLLYSTARTNTFYPSNNPGAWLAPTGLTHGPGTATAPDGTATGYSFTEDTSTGKHENGSIAQTFAAGVALPFNFFVKRTSGTRNLALTFYSGGVQARAHIDLTALTVTDTSDPTASCAGNVTLLPSGYAWVQLTPTHPNGGSIRPYFGLLDGTANSYTGDGTSGLILWGEVAGTVGVYIPTTSAPVTVTDYTLSGTTVTVGQASPSGATLDWSGTASDAETYLVTFPDSIDLSQFMANMYETNSLKFEEFR